MTVDRTSEILLASGARRAEELLIEEALSRLDEQNAARLFRQPIQIVVPSHSLREHLLTRLVAVRGRSIVGLRCSTHRGLALQVLEAGGRRPPQGLDVFAVLARRFARQESSLAEALDDLVDGYSGMLGSVRDLLDAGFQIAHLRGVEEALADEGPAVASGTEVERAQALMRVTARVLAAFEELGLGRSSTLLQEATDLVSTAPRDVLSTSGVLVHGFADATGVAGDFLTALLKMYGGRLVVDRPPDPVDAGREDSSAAYVDRFVERFDGLTVATVDETPPHSPELSLFRALGRSAEVRETAHRVRDLLDAGVEPEAIGIVLREPLPYRSVLRRELARLQVPFSGYGVSGPLTPSGRRLRALQEVVSQGGRCHVERWLDSLAPQRSGPASFDLRVALSALGIARLEQLAGLDLDVLPFDTHYPLPVRQGFYEAEDEAGRGREIRARRRHVPIEALQRLVARSRKVVDRFQGWRGRPLSFAEHAQRLAGLVDDLGWSEELDGWSDVANLLASLAAAPAIELELDELVLVLRRQLANVGQDPFAGRGAGVQVMGVVEARGRTFGHLFLLGLNRGVFPRTVREDPVLSDALRRLLERTGHGVLPDLPIKRRGYDEERYLFAHLLSASPSVTLSWLEVDDTDRAQPASPLIERLRWTHPDRPEEWRQAAIVGRHPIVDLAGNGSQVRLRIDRLPLDRQAVLAGLHGRESHLAPSLSLALQAEHGASDHGCDLERAAAARISILNELDPQTAMAAKDCLSPYLGFIGGVESKADPRANERLYVTALERMAACPWQTFIERLLRVEAVPDPLEALPRIDGLLIGILAHRVLERIVTAAIETPAFADLRSAPATTVAWPEPPELERILEAEATTTVRRAGIALPGFARALAAVARPYLEVARRLDWENDLLEATLGAEVEGAYELDIAGLEPRQLAFRADRIDRHEDGLLLIDYKTGKPAFEQKKAHFRRRAFLRDLSHGSRLQAVAYALAAGAAADEGRFTYLRPAFDGPAEARMATASSQDFELESAFLTATGTVLAAWEFGLFFPRLELPGKPHDPAPACKWCKVAEACLKQDSGARRRLRMGVPNLARGHDVVKPSTAAALLDLWWLPEHENRAKVNDRE